MSATTTPNAGPGDPILRPFAVRVVLLNKRTAIYGTFVSVKAAYAECSKLRSFGVLATVETAEANGV